MSHQTHKICQRHSAFSLVELAVVVVVIGVLAAFGVPRLLQNVERSKASEAFQYLSSIRDAQERYNSLESTYAADMADLDVDMPAPKFFVAGPFVAGDTGELENSWSMTLLRQGASAGFGNYTVTFTDQGYDAANSTIDSSIDPTG